MKKSNWLALILIGLSVAALVGYQFWDRNNTDNIAPEIILEEGTLEVSVHDDTTALLQGITAKDNRDGDVTDSVIVEHVGLLNSEGDAAVRYVAIDRSGNVSKISRNVRYTDYESPRFRLTAPLQFVEGSGFEVVDLMGAWDTLDGDISHRIRATALSEKALSDAGIYDVRFQVTSSMGDTQELTLQVELYPAGIYNANLSLEEYLVYLPVGVRFDAKSYLESFRYSTNRADLTRGVPEAFSLEVTGSVNTGTPGVYEVKYVMDYMQGSQTYTGGSRLVVIVEE